MRSHTLNINSPEFIKLTMPTEIYNPFISGMLNVTQKDYCLNTCYDILKEEIGRELGFDIRIMLFLLFLAIGGGILNYYIFYKKKGDDPNVQKFLRVYIMLSFYLSIILLLMSIKLSLGLPSLF